MSDVANSVYLECLRRLQARPPLSRAARGEAVDHAARVLGVTRQTVYRQLRRRGWTSGRQQRLDAGASSVSTDELRDVATLMARGRNKRGQPNVPTSEARRIACEHGLLSTPVSEGHLCRLLRREGLDLRRMRAPRASVQRRSDHPNHTWFFDISVAIQWYFRDPETGARLALYDDAGARFYEGKRANYAATRCVIHRFVVTDHWSGAYYVRYYYSAGESAVDVIDFLCRAMSAKVRGHSWPFRGLPRRLVMDRGSANRSALVQNLLGELGVEAEYHATANPKASGSVETRHNHWQRSFEGRLIQRPAQDLATLNTWAEQWAATAQADPERAHSRHGRPPLDMWHTHIGEHLREAPPRDVFLQLANANARSGVLTNRLWLRADGRTWQVDGENVYPTQRIHYRLSPFIEAGIRAWDQAGQELAVTELRFDAAGFAENARGHTWDDERAPGATAPRTAAQRLDDAVKAGKTDGLAPPVEAMFDDLEDRLARQAYLAVAGRPWQASPESAVASAPLLSSVDAREHVVHQLGRALTPAEAQWWRARIGDGITDGDLAVALTEFLAPASNAAPAAPAAVVDVG